MNYDVERSWVWKLLFFSILGGYCLYYAPFGVNETDGGFLTGLAWQLLNGKLLYHDMVYVRPPLPVWLRALELQLLPEHFAVLGERWIFYAKVALYSWLGAAILAKGTRRWQLAVFGFVVSAHCYPAMAWHTVDGILFAVLAAFFIRPFDAPNLTTFIKLSNFTALAGISLFCAMLCKQSFYPLVPIFALFLFLEKENRWKNLAWFFGAFALCSVLFISYLNQNNLIAGYFNMTSGAASAGQALQHGLLDYFRITPELALPSLALLFPVARWFWKGKNPRLALMSWSIWLFALAGSYAAITWLRQDHTVPFAQSRVMFWIGLALLALQLKENWAQLSTQRTPFLVHRSSFLLLAISWCASVSWGYNLPILFATPWVWAGMEISTKLQESALHNQQSAIKKWGSLSLLLVLLFAFRIGHEFVYRDGPRSKMQEPMGAIFPALSGIYSDAETAELYRDLKQLTERYGANFKTLPAFPQANFLTHSPPPLPLDWVVNRESNGDNSLIFKNLKEKRPVIFIQKSFKDKIENDPELMLTRQIFQSGKILEETPHFWVVTNYEL